MRYPLTAAAGLLVIAIASLTPGQIFGQTQPIPRTPDGHPDFQGIWTNATLTPLERPAIHGGNPTPEEETLSAFDEAHSGL